jgi:hypothetical protein
MRGGMTVQLNNKTLLAQIKIYFYSLSDASIKCIANFFKAKYTTVPEYNVEGHANARFFFGGTIDQRMP